MVPLLAQAQAPADVLPDGVEDMNLTDSAIATQTSRLLYGGDQERFWVALDEAGNICLLTLLAEADGPDPATDGLWATSCPAPDAFYRSGATLRAAGSGLSGSLGQLIPADVQMDHPDLVAANGAETRSAHFLVRAPAESRAAGNLSLKRATDEMFMLLESP
ncbi:hypothetical protein SAMN04488035_1059 [Flavimobilis marinus]|uniref:Uncharacterized protein n=1 Tax=Flavimobilis marinus TaxID=285351 RepID=A0A1I2F179_9MICO|nr:hypothetical protein [Flavimobilis marinus]SFE98915.1 hypothetical protein SAMN04488035_1059 [Flavimobilis marinus]